MMYICQDMATALVTAEDVNVVIVDWRGGSLPLYSQAAANTRLVGMEVARMVEVSVILINPSSPLKSPSPTSKLNP